MTWMIDGYRRRHFGTLVIRGGGAEDDGVGDAGSLLKRLESGGLGRDATGPAVGM